MKLRIYFAYLFLLVNLQGVAQQANWTHFRGNNLNGISYDTDVPIHWNDSTNILWETATEGKGWSSPVVFGQQVWFTTASINGREMLAICLDLGTGKEIYKIQLFNPDNIQRKHAINSYATPTSSIEKGFVYVTFGTYGTCCINTSDGTVVWKRNDLNCEHVQGSGSSLFLYKNLLIVHCEGTDRQYIAGLDKTTGRTVWITDRPEELYDSLLPIGKKAYTTPIIVNVKGRDLLISNGSAVCIAYDPETGKEVWRFIQGEDSTIAMPVTENGVVFFFTSFVTPHEGEKYAELIALNPDGNGDITRTNVLWRLKAPILQLLTPLVKDGLIYLVDSENKLICLEAKTGEMVYNQKLKSKYHSSPLYADGKIYFTSIKGETMVIKTGRELIIVGENKLDGEVFATPAIVDNSIILRTDSHLYRIKSK